MKRINSTVALTFILLALMFGAGVVSSAWGFAIGREALKGITQPDSRPTNKVNRKNPNGREALTFFKEDDILMKVKSRMGGGTQPSVSPSPSSSPQSKGETLNQQVVANVRVLPHPGRVSISAVPSNSAQTLLP
ncbi:hypothetical protein [Myxacorys almedinensis]|uniref:hypothetical protein n=1 Tax=Myxacorys almedinensis TaxID=2651157 RepID=UPI00192E9543|nr:hypothetical protein [Myxacorys almedinensis]